MTRMSRIGLLVALVAAACGGDDDDDGGAAATDAAVAAIDASVAQVDKTRVQLSATDGSAVVADLYTSPTSVAGAPGVLLVHQFQLSRTQWGTLPDELATAGYRVLAIDLRGHGESDPYDGNLTDILSDPDGAPLDVSAGLSYLRGDGQADPARIAIVGTSIGANLTVAAAIDEQAATYVSLSARQSAVEIFAGAPADSMTSVFFLASDGDSGGTQAANAQTMFDNTAEPRRIHIYEGTSDHGAAILANQNDAAGMILDWLSTSL